MFPIASCREHAPILSQARVAWDFDEADTSLFWSLESEECPVHRYFSVADWEAQDDTELGHHRQGQMEVAGPYYLDGSAFNPEIVELRRAGWSFSVLEPPRTRDKDCCPPCLDASDDDAMEEDWLEDQMQEPLEIDHAEATLTVEPTREPKVYRLHYWRSHSPSCRTHVSPSRGAACYAILEG